MARIGEQRNTYRVLGWEDVDWVNPYRTNVENRVSS